MRKITGIKLSQMFGLEVIGSSVSINGNNFSTQVLIVKLFIGITRRLWGGPRYYTFKKVGLYFFWIVIDLRQALTASRNIARINNTNSKNRANIPTSIADHRAHRRGHSKILRDFSKISTNFGNTIWADLFLHTNIMVLFKSLYYIESRTSKLY